MMARLGLRQAVQSALRRVETRSLCVQIPVFLSTPGYLSANDSVQKGFLSNPKLVDFNYCSSRSQHGGDRKAPRKALRKDMPTRLNWPNKGCFLTMKTVRKTCMKRSSRHLGEAFRDIMSHVQELSTRILLAKKNARLHYVLNSNNQTIYCLLPGLSAMGKPPSTQPLTSIPRALPLSMVLSSGQIFT